MHPVTLLLSLFAVDFLACVSPGPAFVGITQISARHGTRAGLAAVSGLLVAAWIDCAVVLSGLTILFQVVPWLYLVVKVAGGLYLAWIGLKLLRGGDTAEATRGNGRAVGSVGQSFRRGMFIGLTNPKAVVYFASIFTLFLKPGSPLWLDLAAVAIVTFDVAVWYGFVGVLFSRPLVRRAYERLRKWIERAAGAVMVGFGVRLVLSRD
jgi:RhtB (resistance to homoserine/threonine) family protein